MQKLLVSVALVLMLGCGSSSNPTANLAGAVTINGEPVPADAEAGLSFEPISGGKSVAVPIVNGRYASPETPEGPVLVKFYISRREGPVKTSERTGETYQDIANLVPPEHAGGMTIEVSGDNSNQNFEL